MKINLIAALMFAVALTSLPAKAQFYSGYTYNNNAYLNYAIASQRAQATRHKARTSKRIHRKRHARRHSRSRRQARRR